MKKIVKLGLQGIILMAMLHVVTIGHAAKAPAKVLDTVVPIGLSNLDPATACDAYDCRALAHVYEGLMTYYYLERPYTLVPNLAAEMPYISPDKLVYTFKLKQDIRFQDDPCFLGGKGRELIAEDVAYTIKRTAQLHFGSFMPIINKIKGLEQWRQVNQSSTQYGHAIEGLKVIDKYTIQIELNEACPLLLNYLAMPCFYIVPREAVERYKHNFAHHPVGTGPFVLKEWNLGNKLIFTKNPTFRAKYFPKEGAQTYMEMLAYSGMKLPLVDQVNMHVIPKAQLAWTNFKKRIIDVLPIMNMADVRKEVLDPDRKQLKPNVEKAGIGLFNEPNTAGSYYVFNCEIFPFKENPKLRQAMSMAFNKEAFNQLFYQNIAALPESIIPVTMTGHKRGYENPYGRYDLKRAKEYLEEAGYPNGIGLPIITLDIAHDDSDESKKQAEFFANSMKDLGIYINVIQQPSNALRKKVNAKTTMIYKREWLADYPDAMAFLSLLAHKEYGVFLISDPFYAILYNHVAHMEDSLERRDLYERLNEMVATLAPAIWLPQLPHLTLYHNWVKNYGYANFNYGTEQYIGVDRVQKVTSKRRKAVIHIKDDTLTDKAIQKLKKGKEKVQKGAQKVKEGVQKGAQKVKEGVQEGVQKAKEKVKEGIKDIVKEKVKKDVKDAVKK